MSKYTTYVQKRVLKHYTQKTLRNNKIQNMLDNISTRQDWFEKHSNIKTKLKNFELPIRMLDQKLNDFDKEKNNSYEKYDAKNQGAKFEAQLLRNQADLESHKSRNSEGRQLIRELRNEIMQLQESLVRPDPTGEFVIQDLRFGMDRRAATIGRQTAEIKSLQSDLEVTQESLKQLG